MPFIRPFHSSNFTDAKISNINFRLLNNLPVPVVCFDQNLNVSYLNEQAIKLWGYEDVSEIIDKNLSELFRQEKKFKIIYNQLKAKNYWSGRLIGLKKNNSSFDVEVSFKPTEIEGEDAEWIATFKNVSLDLRNRRLHKKYKRRFLNFFRSAPDAVFIVSESGIIEMVNPIGEQLFGYKKEELLGRPVEVLIPKTQREQHVKKRYDYKKCPSQRSMGTELDIYGLRKDGIKIPLDIMLGPLEEETEKKVLVVARDISRIKESNDMIKSSLKEKETLLKEVHHRVKNNLAVVSSLLQLQATQTHSQQVSEALEEGINRIQSIAAVHEQLYQEELFSSIELKIYINELCSILTQNYSDEKRKVGIDIDCDDVKLSMEKAVPAALILNEIITNSFKYATAGGNCQIWISVKEVSGSIVLRIVDTGPGLPGQYLDHNFQDSTGLGLSLGMTLINVLSGQLQASLKIENTPGATYTLQFSM